MRSRVEAVLRIAGVAAIVAWIVNAAVPRETGPVASRGSALREELPRWTRDPAVREVRLDLDSLPDAVSTAWLAALRGAGARVSWQGELPQLALEAFRSAAPAGDVVVLAASPGEPAVLRDDLGAIDTLAGEAGHIRLAGSRGALTLRSRAVEARIQPGAVSREPHAVYVAGAAGWEAKFVIAALEEAGWVVDARLSVAPGMDVIQGRPRAFDTATYSVVVLMDSAAAEGTRGVESFVRSGGGLVLAGDASRARRVAPLVAWRAGEREVAALGTLPGDTAWRGLSRVPLTLASDARALPLETRGRSAAVVARRHHAGRVAAVGYDATWRWRMAGGEHSVAEHREWWTRVVAGVAARPASSDSGVRSGAAPVAAFHAALGPPSGTGSGAAARWPHRAVANMLGLLALAMLLGEWVSRRARGAR